MKPLEVKMDVMVTSKVLFARGEWVLQHCVSVSVSHCTLASVFIAALCLFAAKPSQNCVHWL